MTIAVIGLWQLGETYSAGLAELGHAVIGIDEDAAVVKGLSEGIPPLGEAGLEALLAKNIKEGRLRYSTDMGEIKKCEVVWFTFDTPVDDHDDVQMAIIYAALDKAIPHLMEDVVFVMTSQVPVGTSEKVIATIHAKRPEMKVRYVYTPENLRLGDAVRCFFEPGRIVIGTNEVAARETVEKIFSPLHAEIIAMSVPSAEMAKHALNAFLATSLSFINDIADVCEAKGADVVDVVRALRSDPRIGKGAFLGAGLGFSGGTLGRDLRALGAAAKESHISVPVITSAWEKNAGREKALAERFTQLLGGVNGKKIAVFGVTYKAGTTTLRRSRSIEFAARLCASGATVVLQDPHAIASEVAAMTELPFFTDPYEAAAGCDGIVVATPWPEFKEIDFSHLAAACHPKAVIFDTNNFLYNEYEEKIKDAGLIYRGVGRQ
ncbi:MAG TPA: nucleotide sugar dehydrogenase [Candidatus Paceibacterota bacterium]